MNEYSNSSGTQDKGCLGLLGLTCFNEMSFPAASLLAPSFRGVAVNFSFGTSLLPPPSISVDDISSVPGFAFGGNKKSQLNPNTYVQVFYVIIRKIQPWDQ